MSGNLGVIYIKFMYVSIHTKVKRCKIVYIYCLDVEREREKSQ